MQSLLALAVRALLPARTQWYGSFFIIDWIRLLWIITSLLRGFGNKQGNESNLDKKQPKRYLTELNYTQVFVQILT